MLRSSRANAENSMADKQFPQLVSVNRISKIPIVETGWHFATDVYSKVKESNFLMRWGLGTAESSMQFALEHTLPAVFILERPLSILDAILCKSLDVVEERVPAVTLPPDQLYEKSLVILTDKLSPVLKRADSVKQFGLNRANSAALKFDNALNVADKYIDQYLPNMGPEENHDSNNVTCSNNNKALQTIHRVDRFSRKLQKRLTQHTIAEVKALRQYSEDALRFVFYTTQLMITDPKALKEKAAEIWAELSKDEPENQKRPENLEELTIMVTRELARRIVHLINFSRVGITALPQTISNTLLGTVDFCTQIAETVIKNAHLGGVTETAISQAKVQIAKLQYLLREINVYATRILERLAQSIAQKEENAKILNSTTNNGHPSGSNNLNAVD